MLSIVVSFVVVVVVVVVVVFDFRMFPCDVI